MQEFKGTPGPWINVGGWVDAVKPGELSSIVCAISSVADRNPEYVNDANANLIAAAPELLESLQELFAHYKELADSGDAGNWKLEDQPVGKKAMAAIDKALGK